jgi:hypothetical protein
MRTGDDLWTRPIGGHASEGTSSVPPDRYRVGSKNRSCAHATPLHHEWYTMV